MSEERANGDNLQRLVGCPFCGVEPWAGPLQWGEQVRAKICCRNMSAHPSVRVMVVSDTMPEAASDWNRRVADGGAGCPFCGVAPYSYQALFSLLGGDSPDLFVTQCDNHDCGATVLVADLSIRERDAAWRQRFVFSPNVQISGGTPSAESDCSRGTT